MINARGETVAEKPAFRRAMRGQRCLIVADGFYEWQKQGRVKQPYFVHLKTDGPLAFAGLWESWKPDNQSPETLETCAIITTHANELMREIHDRMPVILAPHEYALWLDPEVDDPAELRTLLDPYPSEPLVADAVSTYVNSPRHDDAKCIEQSHEGAT
jgi:putative SOS response-associated peptidase YedK